MTKLSHLVLGGALLALTATGCSKKNTDQPTPSTGPRDYQVEYRVTSTTSMNADYVSYRNETGTVETLGLTPLTFKYTCKRKMKLGDAVSMAASVPNPTAASEVTAIILLDGTVVKESTGRGISAFANAVYVIQ